MELRRRVSKAELDQLTVPARDLEDITAPALVRDVALNQAAVPRALGAVVTVEPGVTRRASAKPSIADRLKGAYRILRG